MFKNNILYNNKQFNNKKYNSNKKNKSREVFIVKLKFEDNFYNCKNLEFENLSTNNPFLKRNIFFYNKKKL